MINQYCTCMFKMDSKAYITAVFLQETGLQAPQACALQGSLAMLSAQTLSQWASDMHAHAGINQLVMYYHMQQH